MPGLQCYLIYLVIRLNMFTVVIILGIITTISMFDLSRIERRNSRMGSGTNLAESHELIERSGYSNHRLNYPSNSLSLREKTVKCI